MLTFAQSQNSVETDSHPIETVQPLSEQFVSDRTPNLQLTPEQIEAEEFRLVSSPKVEAYLTSLLGKLREQYSGTAEIPEIKIKVTDSGTFAAAWVPQNIIVVDRKLLLEAESEDELASIVAHEFGHFIYRYENGKTDEYSIRVKATVAEETFADYTGQALAVKAGYSRFGLVDFLERLIAKKSKPSSSLGTISEIVHEVTDVHLDPYTRITNLKKDFLGGERLITGNSELGEDDVASRALPDWVKSEVEPLQHRSYVQSFKEVVNFDELNCWERFAALCELMPGLTNQARIIDVSRLFPGWYTNWETPDREPTAEERESAHRLFDKAYEQSKIILAFDHTGGKSFLFSIYRVCEHNLKLLPELEDDSGTDYRVAPIGKLRALERAVLDFNAATTMEEARAASMRYLEHSEESGNILNSFFEYVNYKPHLPAVNVPNDSESSHRSLVWAAEDDSNSIFHFLEDLPYKYRNEDLFDQLPVARLRTLTDEVSQLRYYLENRAAYEELTLPPDVAEFNRDPETWCERYHSFLKYPCSSDLYKLSRFHPYAGKTPEQCIEIHLECCTLVADYWRSKAQSSWIFSIVRKFDSLQGSFRNKAHPFQELFLEQLDSLSESDRIRTGALFFDPYNADAFLKQLKIPIPNSFDELARFVKRVDPKRRLFKGNESSSRGIAISSLPVSLFSTILKDTNSFNPTNRASAIRIFSSLTELFERSDRDHELVGHFVDALVGSYNESRELRDADFDSVSAEELVKVYHLLNDGRFFVDTKVRRYWGERMVSAIEAEKKLARRADLYREALKNGGNKASRIQDLKVRHQLVEGYASTLAQQLRTPDNESERYHKQIENIFHYSHLSQAVRAELAATLAKKLDAQRELSYKLRDIAAITQDELQAASLPTKACETLFRKISGDTDLRHDFLRWITSDGNPAATKFFYEQVNAKLKDGWEKKRFFKDLHIDGIPDSHGSSQRRLYRLEDDENEELSLLLLNDVYSHFVDQEREIQTLLLKQVLIPPKEDFERGEEVLWESCDWLLDELFPIDQYENDSESLEEAKFSRELIRTLLEVSHESERGFILGAITASARNSNAEAERQTVGQLVKGVLTNLGPAYIKLGQALHSSDLTPKRIRDELVDFKGNVNEYKVWQLWELIDELHESGALPEEHYRNIAHLGKISGAASMNLVNYIKDIGGNLRALGLTRRYARDQALKGFDSMATVVERAESLREYRSEALAIIANARKLSILETDHEVGARQAALQYEQYHKRKVTIGWNTFTFKPRRWLAYGDGWRFMEAATGVVFDKLPEETLGEKEHKDRVAQAILTMELRNILRGKQFDYNRHERQYLSDRYTIFPVDAGGMSLELPTEDEKQAFGTALGKLFTRVSTNDEALAEAIAEVWAEAGDSEYLHRIREAMLYLNFTFERLTPEQVQDCVLAALTSDDVDPIIRAEFDREFVAPSASADTVLRYPLLSRFIARLRGKPRIS